MPQQLSTCTSQIECLLSGMTDAMHSVKTFTLSHTSIDSCDHIPPDAKFCVEVLMDLVHGNNTPWDLPSPQPLVMICPAYLGAALGSVCASRGPACRGLLAPLAHGKLGCVLL